MSTLQHRLSEFLECELLHSLGAYRGAHSKLVELERKLRDDAELSGEQPAAYLAELVTIMREYNHELDHHHDAATPDPHADDARGPTALAPRHPAPMRFPLSGPTRYDDDGDRDEHADVTSDQSLTWIPEVYATAIEALDQAAAASAAGRNEAGESAKPAEPSSLGMFAAALLHNRTEISAARGSGGAESIENRKARFERRREFAEEHEIPSRQFARSLGGFERGGGSDHEKVATTIIHSHLRAQHRRPLSAFILRALVDAHLTMHEVEAYHSVPLREALRQVLAPSRRAEIMLNRTIAINTFVMVAARTTPWVFAEDEDERRQIVEQYDHSWQNIVPARTMWISTQISLLALHRRAYAHALLGKKASAYKDYHKLQHTVRDTARRLRGAPIHVEGALEFLESLDALADQHIGELYRSDRDHRNAQTHFERAFDRLVRLRRDQGQVVILNSRWFVQLQLGLGKSAYELGEHKACMAWYLETWRSLLELIADDSAGEVNDEPIVAALTWLERVVNEPAIHKRDVIAKLAPVVEQIEASHIDPRFTALASEILIRLGHLLFILNLVDGPEAARPAGSRDADNLALRCVRRGALLDPLGTLGVADLLKLEYREILAEAERHDGKKGKKRKGKKAKQARRAGRGAEYARLADQWPGGASPTETLSRGIEYVLLEELRAVMRTCPESSVDAKIARGLMHSLFMHTDSIEARKSQTHEYLVRARTEANIPDQCAAPAIEFACLRRYSSALPILPRPEAFRAHGGGYFLRVLPQTTSGGLGSLGIAVDPGTSFVECLYRADYSPADIDVIVVTHNHVDHASSFEPLLALLHERSKLLERDPDQRRLVIVGNESMRARWTMADPPKGKNGTTYYRFYSLDDEREMRKLERRLNKRVARASEGRAQVTFRALTSKVDEDGRGHSDLSGNASSGFLLTLRDRSTANGDVSLPRSVAFTSDLPSITEKTKWPKVWKRAFEADVLVCHVSSVPLSELRQMAQLDLSKKARASYPHLHEDVSFVLGAWEALNKSDEVGASAVASRLKYAFWLGRDNAGNEDSLIDPVGEGGLGTKAVATGHPYLGGLLVLARAFARCDELRPDGSPRLFVVGELSEELGSFRPKIAHQLNEHLWPLVDPSGQPRAPKSRAVTGDLGLTVLVSGEEHTSERYVGLLCSACALDNDTAPRERFHKPTEIVEVCVKGENEGIFYNCDAHAPVKDTDDPTFLEKLERYDVFGR